MLGQFSLEYSVLQAVLVCLHNRLEPGLLDEDMTMVKCSRLGLVCEVLKVTFV